MLSSLHLRITHTFEKHVNLNEASNIQTFPFLLGEECKNGVDFYEGEAVDATSSVVLRNKPKPITYIKTKKKQVSLDYFCSMNKLIPEVIKIDVEGCELNVLRGGEQTLKRYRPVVLISIHPGLLSLMGQSVNELTGFIENLGYSLYNTDGSEILRFKHNEYLMVPEDSVLDEVGLKR